MRRILTIIVVFVKYKPALYWILLIALLFTAQFMYMLSDNNWLKLARSANDLASKLTHELQQIKSIKVVNKVEANIIYVLMPVAVRQALASAGARFFVENHNWLTGEMASDDELTLARFVTSFANTAADIDAVISVIANSR